MSYSFSVNAPTKTDALLAAEKQFDDVVLGTQPNHAKDKDAAFDNLRKHVALLDEPNTDEAFYVHMNGSIGIVDGRVMSVGSGCSVGLQHVAVKV